MPRYARERSETGIYHVMARGIDGQDIFVDRQDRMRYLESLAKVKVEHQLQLHAYCLMSNHVHLLLSEGDENLGESMRRLGTSYASWYNTKHGRVGYLFQGRYRSETVDNDAYFATVFRYIHQNAVKAGLCSAVADYEWSSYSAYSSKRQPVAGLVDQALSVELLGNTRELLGFVNAMNADTCLDVLDKLRCSDAAICSELERLLHGGPVSSILQMNIPERTRLLRRLKEMGASIRQIARLTGINRNIIERV